MTCAEANAEMNMAIKRKRNRGTKRESARLTYSSGHDVAEAALEASVSTGDGKHTTNNERALDLGSGGGSDRHTKGDRFRSSPTRMTLVNDGEEKMVVKARWLAGMR